MAQKPKPSLWQSLKPQPIRRYQELAQLKTAPKAPIPPYSLKQVTPAPTRGQIGPKLPPTYGN